MMLRMMMLGGVVWQVLQERASWLARRASGSTERVEMTLDGERVCVLPLWIAVHQDRTGGLAR